MEYRLLAKGTFSLSSYPNDDSDAELGDFEPEFA
jgi:hypothetical protein